MMRSFLLMVCTVALVGATTTALGDSHEEKPKRGFLKPDGQFAELKAKPAEGAAAQAKLYYGQRVLYKATKTAGWALVKEAGGTAKGYYPQAAITETRPPALQFGSIRGRVSDTGEGGAGDMSTAAVRSLDPRAKKYAEDKGGENMKEVITDVASLEALVDGKTSEDIDGLFPDKKTRQKKAQAFMGGNS